MKQKIVLISIFILLLFCCKKEGKMGISSEIYDIEVCSNHLIATIGGKKVLVDTGSPLSMGCFSSKFFGDIDRPKTLINTVEKFAKIKIDGILGTDLLSTCNFSIRLKEKKMMVSRDKMEGSGEEIPLNFKFGTPLIPVKVKGKEVKMILDTGAFVHYFSPDMVKGSKSVEKKEDFYPLYGKFNVDLYEVPVEIGGKKLNLKGGILPLPLRALLNISTFDAAILGNEIFNYFDIDFINLNGKKVLRLKPNFEKGETK